MENRSLPSTDRQINIDLLRILACFMVVIMHTAVLNGLLEVSVFGGGALKLNRYDFAVRSAIPLFFMISGKLFLGRQSSVSIPVLYKKNILRLLIIYIVWSFLYALDSVGLAASSAHPSSLINAAVKSPWHLWYLPALIGVYLLIPILWAFTKYENGKYLKYYVALFVVFGVIYTTLLSGSFIYPGIATQISKFTCELCGYSGYFILGYFISRQNLEKIKCWHLLVFLLAVIMAATKIGEMNAMADGTPTGIVHGLSYLTLPTFLEAVSIFILFMKLTSVNLWSDRIKAKIVYLSKCTLGIYLIHPLVSGHLDSWFGLNTLTFIPVFRVPLMSMIIFLISMAVMMILNKIPVVNKWLF